MQVISNILFLSGLSKTNFEIDMPAVQPKSLLKRLLFSWYTHGSLKEGAALSFYTIIALPPLFLACTTLAHFVFDPVTLQKNLLDATTFLFGERVESVINFALQKTLFTPTLNLHTIFNLLFLFLLGSGVFWQLQDSLNTILGVPIKKQNFFKFLFNQIGLMSMVGLLCVFFIASTLLQSIFASIAAYQINNIHIPYELFSFLSFGFSLFTFFIGITLTFKFLPQTHTPWKQAFLGSLCTTLLFEIGKYLLQIYFNFIQIDSLYGAASSLIALLLWVYYSSQTIFLGAECMKFLYSPKHS